jgi:hypothetical protein
MALIATQIDVKQAVQLAKDFAEGIYEGEKIARLGLEAVEKTGDGKYWLVTLGFSRPWSRKSQKKDTFKSVTEHLQGVVREPKLDREYKVFKVDARSGRVIGMEIFQ